MDPSQGKVVDEIAWVPVGAGRLALWHRPGRRHVPALKEIGCDTLVTLLSEREGGPAIGELARAAGLEWVWLPLPNSDTPPEADRDRIRTALLDLSQRLDGGAAAIVHCSAGIHRTARRDVLEVTLSLVHVPRPGPMAQALDLASVAVAALADFGS